MSRRKKRLSLDWSLLASAAIFFLLGRFIAPRYEALFRDAGIFEEIVPVSRYALIASGVLAVGFVVVLAVRLFRMKR
jgi:hypothetical protein